MLLEERGERKEHIESVVWLNGNGEEKVKDSRKSCIRYAQFDYRLSFVPSSNNENANLVKIPLIVYIIEQTLDIFVPRDEFARTKREGN